MGKRRRYAVKKLPPGHADGSKPDGITARNRHAKGSYMPDTADLAPELDPRVALWRAVFAQAIMDAKSQSLKEGHHYNRHTALHWLLEDKGDFGLVCELAGYEPSSMRQRIRHAQERGFVWRGGDVPQRAPTGRERLQDFGMEYEPTGRAGMRRKRGSKRVVQLEFCF